MISIFFVGIIPRMFCNIKKKYVQKFNAARSQQKQSMESFIGSYTFILFYLNLFYFIFFFRMLRAVQL